MASDHAKDAFSGRPSPVQACVRLAVWGDKLPHPHDVPGRLRTIRATTTEGQIVKAQAIFAMEEAAGYVDLRDDSIDLLHSLVRDVAGIEAHGLGVDVPPLTDRTPA